MPSRSRPDSVPVEAFLASCAPPMRHIAERLRAIVLDTVPDAIERVRPGWALIGYDLPVRRHGVFFAWIWPEADHVHLGFPHGVLMDDPDGVLRGAGVTKKARWLTYEAHAVVDRGPATRLLEEAVRVAMVPRSVLG